MADTQDELRARTAEEMRTTVLGHIRSMMKYWLDTDLKRPEIASDIKRRGVTEEEYRMNGLVFSILVMLDGGSVGIPAINLSPSPHKDDEGFNRDFGKNWWPDGVVFNECQLHEIWSKMP